MSEDYYTSTVDGAAGYQYMKEKSQVDMDDVVLSDLINYEEE